MKNSKKSRKAKGVGTMVSTPEEQALAAREMALAALPAAYGFTSVLLFVAAVERACGIKPKEHLKGRGIAGKPIRAVRKGRRRYRITDEVRAQVKQRLDAGASNIAIARKLRISRSSVQAIKRALGMVKLRGRLSTDIYGATSNDSLDAPKVLAFPSGQSTASPP
jgi:hypothetical protein